MDRLPGAVLFACTENGLRSPMAEAMLKHLHGHRIYVDSVGVRAGELDAFAVTVMDELGLDISGHTPKAFADLEDTSFDLIISLSPEAQHSAVELTRSSAAELEFWNMFDPSVMEESRELRLDAYRDVRDQILALIQRRFPMSPVADT
ncbi:MAG: arsenate reductase ArsC [Alphaproteobacteria bacterium]|nr:arsenate reductase ArsC [Alphaproteobacteria bacterium]